jgi:hypothetical protein
MLSFTLFTNFQHIDLVRADIAGKVQNKIDIRQVICHSVATVS